MAIVICPECNKQISQYAESCPGCGFPIKKFMIDNNITDLTKAFICPKCADSYELEFIQFKCEYCDTTLVQTDISRKELFKFSCNSSDNEFREKTVELAKKFGDNQFDENVYNERLKELHRYVEKSIQSAKESVNKMKQEAANIPHCPTCNSTNIKKISATSKVVNTALFGLLSNKRKKQFHCNSCGYEW